MAEITNPSIAKRWTPLLVKEGFTPVSTFFLENYHRLEPPLSTLEAMLIILLVKFKWDDRHPRPAFATLAELMGISATAARNHARSLEKKRYLKRLPTLGSSNQFDLTPLFDALERLHKTVKAAEPAAEEPEPVKDPILAAMFAASDGTPDTPDESPDKIRRKVTHRQVIAFD